MGTCPPGCQRWSPVSFGATYSTQLGHQSVSLVNILPSSQVRDNALLQGPIMRRDRIEVSQSQRHLIFKLEHNCLCSTFIVKRDQIKFICTALLTERTDKVHTATKGISRQALTLKHSTHPEIQSLQQDTEVPFKSSSVPKKNQRPNV